MALTLGLLFTVGPKPQPVAAACYWGSPITVEGTYTGLANVVWKSKVTYQIGYSCSGARQDLLISYFRNRLIVSGTQGGFWHDDVEGAHIKWVTPPPVSWSAAWVDGSNVAGCFGNCTVTRARTHTTIMPYNSTAAVAGRYVGCPPETGGSCTFFYQFLRGSFQRVITGSEGGGP